MSEFFCQSSRSSELQDKSRGRAEKSTSHPGVEHPEAIESDYQIKDWMLVLDMPVPLVGHALRRWAVVCSTDQLLDQRTHHLYLNNLQTLYRVESASLVTDFCNL